MRDDLTVIYYTSNREKPEFEAKIRQTLLDTMGDLPLISVSQKPIDFGKNICVGDVEISNYNAFRQLQIGAIEAKTNFVCSAESDCLYPKEYFNYIPKRYHTFCMMRKMYMVYESEYFYSRRVNESAMIVGRNYLIESIEEMLGGNGMWGVERKLPSLFINKRRLWVTLNTPIITFKTPENMHPKKHKRSYIKLEDVDRLPYWGTPQELTEKYYA